MKVRFMITGHGRSGTTWLAEVLDTDKSVRVHHEPCASQFDVARYWRVHDGTFDPVDFVQQRKAHMQIVWDRGAPDDYSEVNSYLRYSAKEYSEEYVCPVVGIIRDGRLTVSSMMSIGVYQRPKYPPVITPGELDGAFEKCCWYWADTYRRLDEQCIMIYRLEDLSTDFSVFSQLCDVIGVSVDRKVWDRMKDKRVNSRPRKDVKWDKIRISAFEMIADDVQLSFYGEQPGGSGHGFNRTTLPGRPK